MQIMKILMQISPTPTSFIVQVTTVSMCEDLEYCNELWFTKFDWLILIHILIYIIGVYSTFQ